MLKKLGVTESSAILEYGCGAGLFIEALKRHGFSRVFGYDPYIPAYSDPAILDRRYDVVTSYDVIEHVDDPCDYLLQLVKPLRTHGILVLGTPNADFISLKPTPYFAIELSQPYHRHIFSEKELLRFGKRSGLEVIATYRRFYFDSLVPTVNTRFMWEYINQNGGFLDVCVQPLNLSMVFRSPRLILYALLGYLWPERGNILMSFRKVREVTEMDGTKIAV